MRKQENKMWKKAGATALAAAMALQMAFVPVLADEADAGAADPQGITADVTISGDMNGTELTADIQLIVDQAAMAESLTGSVDLAGMSLEISQYLDQEGLLLKLPLADKVLSFSFSSGFDSPFLSSVLGEDNVSTLQDILGVGGLPDFQGLSDSVSAVVSEALSSVEMTAVDAKDCQVGEETVSCPGTSMVLTGEILKDAAEKILAIEVAGGKTVKDLIEKGSALSDSVPDIDGLLEELGQLEAVTVTAYLNESYPAEIDIAGPSDTNLSIELRGPADMPYSDIRVLADGTELVSAVTVVSDDGVIAFTLTAQGEVVASFELDMANGTYSLDAQGLPAPISGTFGFTEDGIAFTADVMGFEVNVNAYAGGTAVKPEGDVLDLNSASQEDIQDALGGLLSMFGMSSSSEDMAA